MTNDLAQLVEKWGAASLHANQLKGDAEAAEAAADYTKKAIMDMLEGSIAARQMKAEVHPKYLEKVREAIDAKIMARNQQIIADKIKMLWESQRSENANRREEMRMHAP